MRDAAHGCLIIVESEESMNPESFFLSQEAWVVRKHALLTGYLEHFRSEGTAPREFYCVDTFSTPSKSNSLARRRLEGVAQAFGSGPGALGVKLIKVSTGKRMVAATNSPGDLPFGTVATMEGQLEQLFPRILSIVGNKPAMLFIDPNGSTSLSFAALKSILRRKQVHTELIIKFDSEAIWRRALESCVKECGHTNRCTTVLRQLARILGVAKLNHVASSGPTAALVDNYMLQVAEYGFTTVAHCIRDAVGMRSNSYLIYCTRDSGKVPIVNDLVRATEDRLLEEFLKRQGITHPSDALEADIFLRRQELRHLIADLETAKAAANVRDNEWRILCNHFGEFHQDDFALDVRDVDELNSA
jgi:hypothetical protein